jgi:D-alanyl-D-alanine carboxypeptidase
MNGFSRELGLNQKWNNTSGLPHNPNYSTAEAIMALASLAIKNNLFRTIVTTREK